MQRIILITERKMQEKDFISINEDTIFIIDNLDKDKEFTNAGEPGKIKVGQIIRDVEFGVDFEILRKDEEGRIHVKSITYFHAKTTDGKEVFDFCIGASDKTEALSILRKAAPKRGIAKMISIKESRAFDPLLTETNH
ncbi:MAG: hypothetical protein EOM19_02230 [Candidatus Moranbacteria bacterium]|nr:hypothetical protein [Candidatus Moranbacteria bacterium]